jgi:DMSO/TMAO reductase YedYZ molybdopterin-dependent catalytic subunit
MYRKNRDIKPYLLTRSLLPENQETPIHFLRLPVIPEEYFYRRNHFPYPELELTDVSLSIDGEVLKPMTFSYDDLVKMPSKSIVLPLECSGNKRTYFRPKAFGEQWKDGAVTQGEWKGVSLEHLLSLTGIGERAVEVLFEGYDKGKKPGYDELVSFQRSLPIPKALHPDTIVAYEYNGEKIPFKHGYPLRLIVPQWYAMASVKWLKSITVIPYRFVGPFQTDDYVYYPDKKTNKGARLVSAIKVASVIQQPLDYQILDRGTHHIGGIAWTGHGRIVRIEVSIDEGKTWIEANMYQKSDHPYSWTFWDYTWEVNKKGEYTIMSRAFDSEENVQPFEAEWNRKGYGYNAVFSIKVKIE